MPIESKKIFRIIAIVGILIAALGVYTVIQSRYFRVTSSIPPIRGVVATATNGFELDFNKDLKTDIDYSKSLSDPGHLVSRIRLNQKSLIIEIGPTLDNKKYSFILHNIRAKNGEIIDNLNFDFTAKYMPDDRISEKQKALIAKISQQYLLDYPLIAHLPYSTLDYSLQVVFNQEESQRLGPPVIQAKLLLTHADVNSNPQAAIERYRQEVNDYITSLGLRASDYTIDYEAVQPST